MPRTNLLSLFENFSRFANDISFVQQVGYRRETKTYADLTRIANSCARELKQRGIRSNDRILLWAPNSFEWVASFWGCLLCGAVAVPLDDSSTPEFVSRIIYDAGIKCAFISRSKTFSTLPIPTLVLEDFSKTLAARNDDGDCRRADKFFADEPITRNHIAQILFTSGTTSEPRGVVLTHGNFLANLEPLEQGIDEYKKYERWFHPLRFISLVPLSHVFGQFMTLFVPPLLGATVVFENSQQPAEILRTIKRERSTLLIAVPRMLDALRNALEQEIDKRNWRDWFTAATAACAGEKFLRRVWRFRRIHNLLGWKFWAFVSGGAALSPQSEGFFKRIGYAVVQGYGMTETASLISLNHPFKTMEGSVGKILPGRDIRLANDGEILVRGENVSSGYWEKGEIRQANDDNDGWLRTGDLGELDSEGNLRFKGRKKNVIVTPAGLNIHPEDLESALRRQPNIRDAVVIPFQIGESSDNAEPLAILLLQQPTAILPARVGAEGPGEPLLFTASESGDRGDQSTKSQPMETAQTDSRALSARAAIDSANSTLAEYQRIRRWLLWPDPDFPRTPTSKPRLALIAARAMQLLSPIAGSGILPALSGAEESGAPAQFAGSQANASSLLSAEASTVLPTTESLTVMSSLDRVELLGKLEQRYQVEINETQFANAQTTEDLQKLLAQPSVRRTNYPYPRWPQFAPVRILRIFIYYLLTWPATLLLANPRIEGSKNLAALRGPAIFVSNHITRRADIGLILFSLPARYRHHLATAMGGETLQTMRHPPPEWSFAKRALWKLNYFLVLALFNVFPLPQLSGFRESFRFAGESADRGYSVLVFPEGIINDRANPGMIPFQPGIGLLAENLQIPIVPIRLDGVWQMKKERRRMARRNELTVQIGAPVTIPAGTPAAEIAARLQELVRNL
jgi:long-chain acyl-CoA synthetase